MDEWVMERYELAKERIAQIPQETIVEEPYRDFFVKEAAFLQQIITVMDNGTQGKNFVELKVQNHELYQDILPQNYENSYGIQNFMVGLPMLLKRKHGILRLYWNCFWKSIPHLRRRKFLLRNR